MTTHPSILAWRIPRTGEPGGLPSMVSHRVGHNWSDLAAAAAWGPTRLSRTNNQKRCPFHYRGLECKVGSQELPGVTGKFGLGVQKEAGQRLTEFCQEITLIIANTLFQQHKRWLYTWMSPDGQYQNQTDYILCSQKMKRLYAVSKNKVRSWLWLRSWTPYCWIQT